MKAAALNRLQLDASLLSRQSLRYTPAGVPALDLELSHESQQLEAGQQRQTQVQIRAIAFGLLAEQIAKFELGSPLQCSGFLAAGRGGKGTVFHIQSIQPL